MLRGFVLVHRNWLSVAVGNLSLLPAALCFVTSFRFTLSVADFFFYYAASFSVVIKLGGRTNEIHIFLLRHISAML